MPNAADEQANNRKQATPLSAQVVALLGKVANRFDSQENEEWRWIAHHSSNPLIVEIMQDSTPTTMRVINAIGHMEPVNGITISAQYRIPKGTVSKITRRLLAQELIRTEYLPNNKKEILFRLTPLGRELFEVHRTFDEQMERGFIRFLQRYSDDELRLLIRVLEEAHDASFLELGQTVPTQE